MFKLIRDNIPEIMEKEGQICNFAQIRNPELLTGFLREKLIEEVNEFLMSNPTSDESLAELVDIMTVVNAIYTLGGIDDETFAKLYKDKLAEKGGFKNALIMFIPDPIQQGDANTHEAQ